MRLRFALLAAVLLASACGGKPSQAGPGGGMPGGGMPAAPVQTITMQPQPVPRTSDFVATVRSLESTTIQPQVEGIVRKIFVKSGAHVTAGTPLVQIDPERQQASVGALEAARVARQADVAYTTQQLARAQKLFEAGAVSRQELDQALTARDTAQAQLAAIQSQIKEQQVQLQYYRVTAPTTGVVGDIPVREGDRVTPTTVITTVDRAQGLEAYISVPLEHATDLKVGLPVQLLDTEGKIIATNPITFIAPRADDTTQSVLVKAQLRPAPPGIRPMQYVRARIVWSEAPALTVPVVAVSRVGGQYFVFVAEPSGQGAVAHQRAITVGEIVGNNYVVQDGLKPGDRVIVSNIQKIGEGAPVKPS